MGSTEKKVNVLLLGGGAVGAIAALNIEAGGLGSVTAVLRSNFKIVEEEGYTIESVDHGNFKGWKPTKGIYEPHVMYQGHREFTREYRKLSRTSQF